MTTSRYSGPVLTKEQGEILTAFTGIGCGAFGDFHGYAERILGRPIWTHQFALPEVWEELKEASRPDFMALVGAEDA